MSNRDDIIKREKALGMVGIELEKACQKHPNFPEDPIHQVAIMIEEAGEAMKAAIDVVYHTEESIDRLAQIHHLKEELAQTGAMCIRCLINLPEV
jgi:hypothetical protein